MNFSTILSSVFGAGAAAAVAFDGSGFVRHFREPPPFVLSASFESSSSSGGPAARRRLELGAMTNELDAATVVASPSRALPPEATARIVARARQDVTNHVRYDATYRMLPVYPNGDIPQDRGACTDTVIRAFRAIGIDLQVLVHEDMTADREVYGVKPDANVDHRRVGTLHQFFSRRSLSLSTDVAKDRDTFQPGDVVFFAWKRCHPKYPCAAEHVGIVSDRMGPRGLPLVLQNGGPVATESDGLDHGTLVGHFRFHHVYFAAQATAPVTHAGKVPALR